MALITDNSGFTLAEIRDRVIDYIGNTSTDFKTYVEQTMFLAQFRFCKAHDWRFLHKQNLSLTVINGTEEYALSVANITAYMSVSNVESIFSPAAGLTLRKVELGQLRRLDPGQDDGDANAYPEMWAPSSEDNKIILWPPTFQNDTLKIDGKISPATAGEALTSYPTIPYKYQESYIEYLVSIALDRENDDRAPLKKQEALTLIRMDIQDDVGSIGNTFNARIKHWSEANDGPFRELEELLYQ